MLRHCLLLLSIATLVACAGRREAATAPAPDLRTADAPAMAASTPGAPDALVLERTIAAHLRFLASDALGGRGSGTRDEWITATYLGARLAELGLEPMGDDGWFVQPVEVQRFTVTGMPTLAIGERTLTHGGEMLVRSVTSARITGPLRQVVAGQPVAPGSIVVVPADAPPEVQASAARAAVVLVRETPAVRARWARAATTPPSAAAQLVNVPAGQPAGPTVITLDTASHDAALSAPDGTSVTFEATVEPAERTTTWNAVGKLPGREPAGASEIIVLSAHLDHVGTRPAPADNPGADVIYNGADDDASGVVAVLELARALAAGPRPRRTVVFAFFGSEEAGGFGSRYFVTRPTVPLTDIVANLQFEMIGRPDPAVPPGTLWLTGFERSTLGTSLAAHGANLVQDPHPAERFFEQSDNIQFARRGVVAHTVSSYGLHTEYHQPSDEFRHLNLAHMREAIASLVAPVRWLADTDTRPAWHPGQQP